MKVGVKFIFSMLVYYYFSHLLKYSIGIISDVVKVVYSFDVVLVVKYVQSGEFFRKLVLVKWLLSSPKRGVLVKLHPLLLSCIF